MQTQHQADPAVEPMKLPATIDGITRLDVTLIHASLRYARQNTDATSVPALSHRMDLLIDHVAAVDVNRIVVEQEGRAV